MLYQSRFITHTVEYNMRDGEHDTQKKKFAED